MGERLKMLVELDVTEPQALALQAMFEHWNRLSDIGASRRSAFCVMGNYDFHPNVQVTLPDGVTELTDEIRRAAMLDGHIHDDALFDYDRIAWLLDKEPTNDRG